MSENKNKPTIESWTIKDGTIESIIIKEFLAEWHKESEDEIMQSMQQNIGIGFMSPMYIEINNDQNLNQEYNKILEFLEKYKKYYSEKNNVPLEEISIEFINYGKTELVYVLTEKSGNRVTLLVKQPAVKKGQVKKEAKILSELKTKDKQVVSPIDYFEYEDQELYVTPYINQARCIASDDAWGMYIPEPTYRFESFSKIQEHIVNQCMIAKLVSLYDFEKEEGICKCKIGGGDFMLPKGLELEEPTIENTFNSLYLIAAREKIKCSFDMYLEILRDEFSKRTISLDQNNLIINLRGRVPMALEDIEEGIKLGRKLLGIKTPNEAIQKIKK